MPEELALNEVFRDRRAVHLDERLVLAAALGVQQAALFGSSSPHHTPPLNPRASVLWLKDDPAYQPPLDCAPCFERSCPLGHTRCLNDLRPTMVLSCLARETGDGSTGP
jgi:heptosyltransferase-2